MTTAAPFRTTFFPSSRDARRTPRRRHDGRRTRSCSWSRSCRTCRHVLADWAARTPERVYLAQRAGRGGPWIRHTYAAIKRDADAVAQWLLDRRDRSRAARCCMLSGNSIAHAVVKYGAMAARVPTCPVSVNYSLMPGDFGRLRHVVALVKPAVVFAEQAATFRACARNRRLRRRRHRHGRSGCARRGRPSRMRTCWRTPCHAGRRASRSRPSIPTRLRRTC